MKHLDEATILAVRDGEPVDPSASSHLKECSTCRRALAAARDRVELIERTLAIVDRPAETTAARAGVRARLGNTPRDSARRSWGGRHLGRAAALLLVTAGAAAAALPGSPVWRLLSPSPAPEPVEAPPAPAPVQPVVEATEPRATPAPFGISVEVPDGLITVVVRGADPGSEISVEWTEELTASLTAPAGSRFTYAAGRVEVDASRGAILVQLPGEASFASLEVDGEVYLAGSREDLTISGPTVEGDGGVIRFVVDHE